MRAGHIHDRIRNKKREQRGIGRIDGRTYTSISEKLLVRILNS